MQLYFLAKLITYLAYLNCYFLAWKPWNCALCLPWIAPWTCKFSSTWCVSWRFLASLHLFFILLWSFFIVRMNGIFPVFTCCFSHQWSHHTHTPQPCIKMPKFFSHYAVEIPSTHHQLLYLFHTLKKHTRDKY